MKSRPMIFSAPMVRAILADQKTQTRRVVKLQPPENTVGCVQVWKGENHWDFWGFNGAEIKRAKCPYGIVGDRLWVRETYAHLITDQCPWRYKATDDTTMYDWKSSMFMPRAASRIELEITDIRIERLQDISEADARSEGITDGGCLSCGNHEPCGCCNPTPDARDSYIWLWESINGQKHPWSDNPWVWVVQFNRVEVAA